jgi:hypothetical protein
MSGNFVKLMASPRRAAATPPEVSWDDAKEMVLQYWNNANAILVPVKIGDSNKYEKKRLKGLRVKWSDLQLIKDNDEDVDEIFIMFGVRAQDIALEDDDDQHYTTIFIGLKNNELVTTKLIDFCDPCPNKCPKDFEQLISS